MLSLFIRSPGVFLLIGRVIVKMGHLNLFIFFIFRLILSMFSSKLKILFKSSPLYLRRSTLFLPESSYDSISNVLRSIYSGVNPDLKDSDQQEFEETFHLLGFDNKGGGWWTSTWMVLVLGTESTL